MPKKKIFDITPPGVEISPRLGEGVKMKPPRRRFAFKKVGRILVTNFLIIVVLIFIFFFLKPRVVIEIWPEIEEKFLKTDLTIITSAKEIDLSNLLLPGEIITAKGFFSQEFSSSGTKIEEGKAKGIIRVYNAYSIYSQPLIATTRFVSAEGKLFRTPKAVVIPGGRYEEGKLVPGEIDIEVVADQPGEDYNIGPSTFSIPGFVGTPRYTAFYAKSFEPMTGGFRKEVSQVKEEDLESSQEFVKEKAIQASLENLKTKISLTDFLFLEGAKKSEIIRVSPLAEVGQELEKFVVQAEAETKTLVFKKSDLEKFAKSYILTQIPQGKVLKKDGLDLKYQLLDFDFKEEKLTLSLDISAKIYSEIDREVFESMVKGKNSAQIQEIFQNYPEISGFKINFWPFWVKKVPLDSERINIKLRVD